MVDFTSPSPILLRSAKVTVIVLVAEGKRPRERMQRSGDKMRKDAREKIKKQERERARKIGCGTKLMA